MQGAQFIELPIDLEKVFQIQSQVFLVVALPQRVLGLGLRA